IPSASEIEATGTAREAAAEIQAQIEDWRGGRASPTRIADAGARETAPEPVADARPSRASSRAGDDERLELVPPKAGSGNIAMADQPGGNASGAAVSSALKAELARAKEALATREQETGELRSRVRELEELGSKNDRLISLKDSEIADLQRKLRELQEQAKAAPVAAPVAAEAPVATPTPATTDTAPVVATAEPSTPTTTVTATPAPEDQAALDKKDIWGDTAPEVVADTAAPVAAGDAAKPAGVDSATVTPAAGGSDTTPAAADGDATADTPNAAG